MPLARRAALLGDDLDQTRNQGQAVRVVRGALGIGRLALGPHPTDERDGTHGHEAPFRVPGRDGRVVLGAVEGEVRVHVPRERIEGSALPEEAPFEARRVGHHVGDRVPVARRRLRLRTVGPELGHDPSEVAERYDLRWVRLPGDGVLFPPLSVVRAERVVTIGPGRDVDLPRVGRVGARRFGDHLDDPILHRRTDPRYGPRVFHGTALEARCSAKGVTLPHCDPT